MMADYIKRKDAIDYIESFVRMNKYYHPYSKSTTIPITEAIARIELIPSEDVQPVVRCKDCQFWNREHISCEGLARCITGESGVRYRGKNDFCSKVVRMDGGT